MTEPRLSDLTSAIQNDRALNDATRFWACVAMTKSDFQAVDEFESRYPRSTHVALLRKSLQFKDATAGTPNAGGSPSSSWGSELAIQPQVSAAITQFARQLSILGRLGLTRAPFATAVPRILDDNVMAVFRGPGTPKLAINGAFNTASLKPITLALIVAFTQELARLSNDVSTVLLRTLLGRAIARGTDAVFFSTTTASEETPGGALVGLSAITSTGDPVADLKALLAAFVAGGGSIADAVLAMSSENAVGARLTGNVAFTGLGRDGGEAAGLPTICGGGIGDSVVVIDRSKTLLADDGIARVDSATHATLSLIDGSGGTPDFGLWQRNCAALRVEQGINWSVAEGGVQVVSGANYLNAGSA